ncbi:hypothetical protein CHS0354_020474 [Potamilus streckersoni]|uniref:Uncharacterized protein n=1 Tax=Potamilus streckersoni TaxID=2493646 RepID=A0AAE0W541_9BIVA|nr:hypothetical protein CHS0354_020474 [Potamilus streckersoni]
MKNIVAQDGRIVLISDVVFQFVTRPVGIVESVLSREDVDAIARTQESTQLVQHVG